MENEQNGTIKSGSVYITVDKFFNPVHISMKGTGEVGFQEFMQKDVEKALKSEEMPAMGCIIMCPIWVSYLSCRKGTMRII